ncbi:GIN domain-containing protein [Novosphingobium sp. 9U]|uniref:GIN domain-containing protein n=1 Tax=Novosphingobium sp. 9U TaxID=2653158 RepID=UPI0012EFC03E|nr:DUF2807 domain-containing protein [Novosphingobium sp. 9U]VWX53689.1 Putative auto-transporter adhesin, head GIN domain [Novosphingobium sp. 9U]
MLRKLLIVFASGLVIAIVALSAAWMAGGRELRDQVASGDVDWTIGGERLGGPRVTRQFALASGARLIMALPVDLEFRRGDQAGMTVEGPKQAVDRLVWEDGRLSLPGRSHVRDSIKVTIVAPEIGDLDLNAPADVELRGLNQEQLRLTARGAVDLDATGRVRKLWVTSEGAADIDVSELENEDAVIRVHGVGDVEAAPVNLADIEVNGAGNITLKKRARTERAQVHGVGSVEHVY